MAKMTKSDACPRCGYSSDLYHPPIPLSDVVTRSLNVNLPPSDCDAALFRATRKVAEENLAEMEILVERMRKNLRKMQEEEWDMGRIAALHKRALSPLRRLPKDVLREIFLLAVADNPASLDARIGPWPISQVCGSWRSIVLSTPRLWSSILIHCPIRKVANSPWSMFDREITYRNEKLLPKSSIPILKTILTRSSATPLDIVFDISIPSMVSQAALIIPSLTNVCRRWRSIHLKTVHGLVKYFDQVKSNVDRLEELTIDVRCLSESDEVRIFDTFMRAPKLRKVCLGRHVRLKLQFPWPQITHFHHLATGHPTIFKFFRNATIFDIDGPAQPAPEVPGTTVRLEHVRQLNLTGRGKMLGWLTLPSLEEMSFRGELVSELFTEISGLLNRSSCRLTRLKINSKDTDFGHVPLELLRAVSSSIVEFDLTIHSAYQFNKSIFLDMLVENRDSADPVFPRLEHLRIDTKRTRIQLDTEGFVSAISSRTGPLGETPHLARLRTLYFWVSPMARFLTLETIGELPLLWEKRFV